MTSASMLEDLAGRNAVGAKLPGECRATVLVDVGECQPRAVGGEAPGEVSADAADALDRDMDALGAVAAEPLLDRGEHAQIYAERGERTRVATGFPARIDRQSRDIARMARDLDEVGNAHADILGSDVASAERFDFAAIGGEKFGRFFGARISQDHRLAAAHRQAGHRVLVAHPARQAQRVDHAKLLVGIFPVAHSARCGAEMRRMDRDNAGQPGRAVEKTVHRFVLVEIGQVP